MEIALSLIHLVFVGFFALFPPVNPVGTALMVDPFLRGLNRQERKSAAFKISIYGFLICGGTLLIGSWLFKLFGISLPVVQIAGGILICKMGWQLLSSDQGDQGIVESEAHTHVGNAPSNAGATVEKMLFYPLSFPMTTGAGTISVLLTLSAQGRSTAISSYVLNLASLFVAIALMCILIYFSYAYTPVLLRRLGGRGGMIVNRLSAFIVFCVGIQIGSEGILALFGKI